MPRLALFALVLLALAPVASAQPTYNQAVLSTLLDRPGYVPETAIRYATYRLEHPSGNSVLARHALYETIGEGDPELGRDRLVLAQLLGGPPPGDLEIGDTLTLPARPADFDLGALAYAPYPPFWLGAFEHGEVVIVDKTTQTWAAYEDGHLERWGPASTGKASTPTPTGRFTMNWRQLSRNSTAAPPGEVWHMRYVMNIHAPRGIHLHQYDEVPTGPPQGHGCIRLVEADARWLWDWSEVGRNGTMVIVQGTEPPGPPVRFVDGPRGPERVMVSLPENPMAVPNGER
ncbi:MAG: L,D-transpeptidase [Bacteroidota bacterium]